MRFSCILRGVLLLLLMLPGMLQAQDAPAIMIDAITDARGEPVDKTNAPLIIHVTGKVVNAMNLYFYLVVHDGDAAWIQSTIGLGHIVSNSFDFFGHCTLGSPHEGSSIDKRYRVFAVVTDTEHERYRRLDETTVLAKSNLIELFRPVATPRPAPPPRPVATPRPAPPPQPAPPPDTVMTARITSPHHGAKIARKIAVEGFIAGLRPDHQVFLCLRSMAFGRLIYPQGKVIPDATGKWTVESIYATPGYSYETFVVITTNTASAAMLNDQQSRYYGMPSLPPSTERLGPTIIVTRE